MKRFLLVKTTDNFGFGGANCHELYCTLLKDGSLSLRECVNQYSDGGRFYLKSFRGINTPKQLIHALDRLEGVMDEFTVPEVLEHLFEYLPFFSALTAVYHRISDSNDEKEFFEKNYNFMKSITFDIPQNWMKSYSLFDAIFFYTIKWHHSKQSLPNGNHKILGRDVIFSFPTK